MDIVREKIAQAIGVLNELDIDVWLLFVRETTEMADPSFKLVSPASVVWPSAFIFSRSGERIVIVGRFDAESFRRSGLYSEVVGYDAGIGADLRRTLERLAPRRIAINYSVSSHAADGITYGMYLALREALAGTPFAERLVSGEEIVARVRGRKSPGEVALVQAAVSLTQQMFADLAGYVRPGRSEAEIFELLHRWMRRDGVEPAWEAEQCPIVNAGAVGESGHAGPTDKRIERGHIVHLDFGVRKEGYCSDLQRIWYLRRPGERQAPAEVRRAFAAVRGAIEAGAAALRPGAVGWQVDAAARTALVAAGYPEYMHALGHQLGRTAHDGSTILGPRWERYGTTPYGVVEPGQVFTLELGVTTAVGLVSLEEDVVVTADGCRYLSTPQTAIWYV